ncbi:MAG: hypothetical protein WC522_00845 [Candidatus Omnitrophota bacterium]
MLQKFFRNDAHRIFAIAILISLAWHLFWMATITIVSGQPGASQVKFSRVSFLGPLLGSGTMELQARPKERSFLEKRYSAAVSRLSIKGPAVPGAPADKYENDVYAGHSRDERIIALIADALGSEKLEPSREE